MITPSATGSEAVFSAWLLLSVEFLMETVFSPSIPTSWLPEAVPVTPLTWMSPVE